MWLSLYFTILSSFAIPCLCDLRVERRNGSRISLECLETLIDVTDWSGLNFLVIFDEVVELDVNFFQRYSNFAWKMHSRKNNNFTGFFNVIIFAKNFQNLNKTLSAISIRRIDSRAKLVISVGENFASLDEIRRASIGISATMWKLDKTRVVYLVPCKNNILAMTYFPFASNCKVGNLEVLDTWTGNNFVNGADLFPEKMLDIQGCVQNHSILFDEAIKLQVRMDLTETGKTILGGVGGRLITIVAEKMNMGLYLLPEKPESWLELINQIMNGQSLFSVGGNIPIANRLETLDLDFGYMEESFGFGYRTGGFEVSWKNVVSPLSIGTWISVVCTFLLFELLIVLLNRSHHLEITSDKFLIFDTFGIFLGNSRVLPLSFFGRYLIGIWIIYSYLINASYNSGLVSFLTTPHEKRVINTFEDLLADGMEFGGGEFHQKFYYDLSDPVMMKIYNNFKIWSIDDSNRFLINRQGATGVISSFISMYNSNQTDTAHQLRMLKDKVFTFHVPVCMRRGSPFVIGVHRYTSQAIQSGLLQYWMHHYTRTQSSGRIVAKKPTVISMEHLRGIMYLHIAGLILSSAVFSAEFIFHKYSSRQ